MRLVLIPAALLAFAGHAVAQDAPAPTSHERAAAELIEVIRLEAMAESSVDLVTQSLASQSAGPAQAGMAAEIIAIMTEFRREFMRWEDLLPDYIRIYTDAFSEAELRELIAFYRSPVGQKALDITPELMRQSVEISQRRMQQHMPELQRRIRARIGGGPLPRMPD